jgi:CRISPR/Cas system-associated endonuclease/helicase Cas3
MEEFQNAKRLYEDLNKTGKLDREVLCVRGRMKLRDRRYRV